MDVVTLLIRSLREHIVLVAVVVALVLTGTISFRTLLYTAPREIVYDGRLGTTFCTRSNICYGRYELAIGNTGSKAEDGVTAELRIDPAKWSASHEIRNIAADRARTNDPEVRLSKSDSGYRYTLDRFAAGALILVTFECRVCNRGDLERAKRTQAEIRASGTVLHGDPRVTTLSRRLSQLF